MKSVFHTKDGSPDVLEMRDIEKPTPRKSEARIKQQALTGKSTDGKI